METENDKMLSVYFYRTYSLISSMESELLSWGQYKPEFAAPWGAKAPRRWHTGCQHGSICNCSTWTGKTDLFRSPVLCLTNTEEN